MSEGKATPRIRVTISTIALSIVASAAAGFGATSAWATGNAGPDAYLQALSRPGTSIDQLPPNKDGDLYFEGAGLRYESTRYLGATAAARFWVAINEREQICLVNILTATGGASMSCVTAHQFGKSGVSSSVTSVNETGEEGYVEAYLIPDSLSFTEVPEGLSALAGNVITGDSRGHQGPLTASTLDGRAQIEMQLVHPEPVP